MAAGFGNKEQFKNQSVPQINIVPPCIQAKKKKTVHWICVLLIIRLRGTSYEVKN